MKLIDLSNSNDLYKDIVGKSYSEINHFWLGLRDYNLIWDLQKQLHSMVVSKDIKNIILYLEHNNVYTLGKNSNLHHILSSKPKEVEIIQSDRGGDVTYHGPGQLVGYPIINLNDFKKSVSWYMRTLERVVIDTLNTYEMKSHIKEGLAGVWVGDEKICAMGVRMARWSTMHGFALNVSTNLDYYDGMIPCGIFEYGVTSINKVKNSEFELYKTAKIIGMNFNKLFLSENIKLLENA